MIDSIRMMLDLFNKKKEISYSEKVCFSTKRLDYTYIRRIRDIVYSCFPEGDCHGCSFTKIDKLLFVLMYFYSPKSLFGVKIKKGLRFTIAKELNIRSLSNISRSVNNICSMYFVVDNLQEELDGLILKVEDNIGDG